MHRPRKAPTRSAAKREAFAQAARINVPKICDVCVVGGGASGLVAGIIAAEAGMRIVVVESRPTCGQPILATGNGRCNFCNADLDPQHYNNPGFVTDVAGKDFQADILEFFSASGLAWVNEEGRLYPLSRQAASVRNVLLSRAQRAGVVLAPAREVVALSEKGTRWVVTVRNLFSERPNAASLQAKALVVATGGAGGALVKDMGLRLRTTLPVLCSLACNPSPFNALDGRRVHARVRLWRRGALQYEEAGEVLFRSYGLSGIVIFNISRRARKGDTITLNLLPEIPPSTALELVRKGGNSFDGLLDPVIAQCLLKTAEQHWWLDDCCLKAPKTTDALSYALKLAQRLPFVVEGPADPQRAQVLRGGLSCEQFNAATLEAKEHPGLFACGEALDIDGDCGGYNLAWAWKSGMVAGSAAAAYASHSRGEKTHD